MKVTTSAAEASETEGAAETPRKHKGRKSVKTRAQKDAHNARCVKYRQKIKRKREELEQVETKYNEMVPKFKQLQAQNQDMKMELEQNKSKIRRMESSIQVLKRILQTQGKNFSSFDESVNLFASQTYNVQDGQGSATSAAVLQDAVGLGATATDNFLPSTSDLYRQMGFDVGIRIPYMLGNCINQLDFNTFAGPDFTNITAPAAGLFSVTNHVLPFVFDVPDSQGVGINSAAGSSFGANHDHLPVFDAPNNHDNLVNNHLAAGVVTNLAARSSFGANPELPNVFNATNNHENDGDLLAHAPGPDAGFQLSENPSSEAFGDGFHKDSTTTPQAEYSCNFWKLRNTSSK